MICLSYSFSKDKENNIMVALSVGALSFMILL
jgi:hypothetical protein